MRMNLLWLATVMLVGGCVIPLDRSPSGKDSEQRTKTDHSFFSLKDPVCGVTCIGDKCERETFQDKHY